MLVGIEEIRLINISNNIYFHRRLYMNGLCLYITRERASMRLRLMTNQKEKNQKVGSHDVLKSSCQ